LRRVALAVRHSRIGSEQSHSNSAPHRKRAQSSRSTQVERALLRTLGIERGRFSISLHLPFSKRITPRSKRISAQTTFRSAFGVQPSASGTTVVHFSCEPLRDESTATKNDNQKQQIGENLSQEPSKSIRLYPWNFTDWLGV
jgi:hypothetical protein